MVAGASLQEFFTPLYPSEQTWGPPMCTPLSASACASLPSGEKLLRLPGTSGTAGWAGTIPIPLPLCLSHVGCLGQLGGCVQSWDWATANCHPILTRQRKSQRPQGLYLPIWKGGGSP